MTQAEFEKLRTTAAVYGDTLGVSVTLRVVKAGRPPFAPRRTRIMLRAMRFVPGESVREYSAAHGYRLESSKLKDRIFADIRTAAEKLHAAPTGKACHRQRAHDCHVGKHAVDQRLCVNTQPRRHVQLSMSTTSAVGARVSTKLLTSDAAVPIAGDSVLRGLVSSVTPRAAIASRAPGRRIAA